VNRRLPYLASLDCNTRRRIEEYVSDPEERKTKILYFAHLELSKLYSAIHAALAAVKGLMGATFGTYVTLGMMKIDGDAPKGKIQLGLWNWMHRRPRLHSLLFVGVPVLYFASQMVPEERHFDQMSRTQRELAFKFKDIMLKLADLREDKAQFAPIELQTDLIKERDSLANNGPILIDWCKVSAEKELKATTRQPPLPHKNPQHSA
jgi:hypothetical protein